MRYLEGYFKNRARIEKEQQFKRNRIDILIELDGHEVGLELKVPTKRGSLTRLEEQIKRYRGELGRFIDDLIFVILEVAEVEDLPKWVDQAKEKYGVHIVILGGKLKRRKRQRRNHKRGYREF
ncbi:hypothetical protein K1720_07590 [Thermococcus argininiproducens]|uniref:Uncharacterized protein n=1 Tax=Thermococcus argininiproducens TaxID=2866384 RepID=A0A9E7M9F3_9EURY|nr:hypothetical protein [Thermococcus argininiproducens]USG99387.1 hypothetical protein K1720_07590 [Thermococcus argininiproducens]